MFGALRAHGGDIFTFAMRKKIKIDAKKKTKTPQQFRMIETGTAVGEALQTNEAVAEDSFFFLHNYPPAAAAKPRTPHPSDDLAPAVRRSCKSAGLRARRHGGALPAEPERFSLREQ